MLTKIPCITSNLVSVLKSPSEINSKFSIFSFGAASRHESTTTELHSALKTYTEQSYNFLPSSSSCWTSHVFHSILPRNWLFPSFLHIY